MCSTIVGLLFVLCLWCSPMVWRLKSQICHFTDYVFYGLLHLLRNSLTTERVKNILDFDSCHHWYIHTVVEEGGLARCKISIQPTISFEMPVPSQDHCGNQFLRWWMTNFVGLFDFDFDYGYDHCSVILFLPLFRSM